MPLDSAIAPLKLKVGMRRTSVQMLQIASASSSVIKNMGRVMNPTLTSSAAVAMQMHMIVFIRR